MHNAHGRKRERREQPIELVPVQFPFAVSAAEPATPRAMNQKAKLLQRLTITRDSVVRIVSSNLPTQSGMLVDEPIMTMGSAPAVNGLNRTSQAGRHRLALDDSLTAARAAPVVRESQQVESRRLTGSTPGFARRQQRTPEVDEPRFLRMNRQAELRATFAQHGQHTTSVRFHFEDQHRIIRVSNQVGSGTHARQHVVVKPLVQNIVEIYIRQQRRNDST